MAGTNSSLKRGAAREIISLPVSEVRPYEKNPRKNAEAVKYVKASIEKFGFKVPIVIDSNRVVVCGHTRLMAAKSLGMAEVPCIMASDLTDEQIKAFRLADNKVGEFAEWDDSLLGAELSDIASMGDIDMGDFGFDLSEFDNIGMDEKTEVEEDEVPEEVEPVCKKGEIWLLGDHRLMCGDSTDAEQVAKLMDGEKADLWLTDPPYNVEIVGGSHAISAEERKKLGKLTIQNDKMDSDTFFQFLHNAFNAAVQVMKDGASFYIWFASREYVNFELALNSVGLQVRQELIWNKNSLVMGRQDYQWKHEPCLYGWKDGASHNWYGDRKQTTIIDWDRPTKSEDHPTMKPVGLFGYQIQNSSKEGDIILDSFGGSGTTIVACEQIGRKARLMELDPHYCDVIIARWEKLTGQKAVKL
jgi:site-specific DNA-methyltransferase (adenine-specific)